MIYQTKDGETLDMICWRHYGQCSGFVEKVLMINRHLENFSAVLPAGIKIKLPTIEKPKSNQKIKMWQ